MLKYIKKAYIMSIKNYSAGENNDSNSSISQVDNNLTLKDNPKYLEIKNDSKWELSSLLIEIEKDWLNIKDIKNLKKLKKLLFNNFKNNDTNLSSIPLQISKEYYKFRWKKMTLRNNWRNS